MSTLKTLSTLLKGKKKMLCKENEFMPLSIVNVLWIYLESTASSHSWHDNVIFCTLEMNLPSLIASLPSPTNLHGYEKAH
jgi:hypothetical protein